MSGQRRAKRDEQCSARHTCRVSAEQEHWERVYAERAVEDVSWFEEVPTPSLAMIEALDLSEDAPIVDVGGGASRLAEELWRRGHTDITVIDIAAEALRRAREEFAESKQIEWVAGDVRRYDFGRRFALWHDRAVFHFMVTSDDRRAYLEVLRHSVRPGGDVLLATFGREGPERCSGLPVARHSPELLVAALDGIAELRSWHHEEHRTPSGEAQQFLYAHFVAPG